MGCFFTTLVLNATIFLKCILTVTKIFCANVGRQNSPQQKNEEKGIIKSNFLQEWLTQCLDCGKDFNPAVLGKLSELLLSLKWLLGGTFNNLRKKKIYIFDIFLPLRALFGCSHNKHTHILSIMRSVILKTILHFFGFLSWIDLFDHGKTRINGV